MKPGRSTIDTLTEHVLNFETSRRADQRREWRRDLLLALRPLDSTVARLAIEEFQRMNIAHRELRRAARRLANKAFETAVKLDLSKGTIATLVARIQRLENEIDRLEALKGPKVLKPEGLTMLSEIAGKFAEQISKLTEEGMGITVVLSTDKGTIGVASNVDPDTIVRAITGWRDKGEGARRGRPVLTGIPVSMSKDTIGTITNEMMNKALDALGRLEAHAAHGLMPIMGPAAFDKAKQIAAPVRELLETILEGNDDDEDFETADVDLTGGTKQ